MEAQALVAELWPTAWALNYHILLGGGVLRRGYSPKDLDLVFLPLNGHESNAREILGQLWELLGRSEALRDHPDYQADAHFHFQEAQKFNYLGKRIDVFIQ